MLVNMVLSVSTSRLFLLKFHLSEQLIENIFKYEILSALDASPYEQCNASI